ncbi:dihydrofolate reductase [Prevotella sp. DNF00663]|uniref:dihydrofolate reductase n=1 Tax=unclassified Prevotella TaxID=2638335 RepID=UPI0005132661|nr:MULTISPECIES: dihydrofolate reductase [unclassified Prevotella]KGI59974.1 diacylglycerol kinase [Prevotella sp. S7 MS 2]KXB84769.1 dihydrofolate reductase [Prevotella sp. DNF00663]
MMINIIACLSKNRAIGLNNQLLYHIKADMARFKQLTMGHTILMGRRTYDSLPHGALPGRRNIVLSRQLQTLPDSEVYASLEMALEHCAEDEYIYIIGGAELYEQTIGMAQRLYLTIVDDRPMYADTFFPLFESDFKLVSISQYEKSEDAHYAFAFLEYVRV